MLLSGVGELGKQVQELLQDRDDLLVGAVAAFLDFHRLRVDKGLETVWAAQPADRRTSRRGVI